MINLAVDFDGTIVVHEFPHIGEPVPGAFEWLKRFQEAGARLILWTMRSDSRKGEGKENGPVLTQAVEFCRANGIEFWGINENPEQGSWTCSPKAYAQIYIDDAAFGCPLRENPNGRPFVDWDQVGPAILNILQEHFK